MAALIVVNFNEQRVPSDRTEQYVLNIFDGAADNGVGVEEIFFVLVIFVPYPDDYMNEIVDDCSDSDYSSEMKNEKKKKTAHPN